jgi:hypothetical protein
MEAFLRQNIAAGKFHSSRLNASGRYAAPHDSLRQLPSLFGLAPCGVYPASGVTVEAVRSYRTFSPLPLRGAALWTSPLSSALSLERGSTEAVCFLWHWPSTGFEARIPDVIRHTALWSSDFPPPDALHLRALPRQRPPGPLARD